MPFVVDASVIAAWALDEGDVLAEDVSERVQRETAFVPGLFGYELRNVLVTAERRGRLSERRTSEFLSRLAQVTITVDHTPDEVGVMSLARRHRLTVYDAAYLELALRQALPLATLDGDLARAAEAEGVAWSAVDDAPRPGRQVG